MARRTPHIAWICIASSHDTGRPLALVWWSAAPDPAASGGPVTRPRRHCRQRRRDALRSRRRSLPGTTTASCIRDGSPYSVVKPTDAVFLSCTRSRRRPPQRHHCRTLGPPHHGCKPALTRPGLHLAPPISRLPGSQRLARWRPRLPRPHLHRMRRRSRAISRQRITPTLLRDFEHSNPPPCTPGKSVRPDPVPERWPLRTDCPGATRTRGTLR